MFRGFILLTAILLMGLACAHPEKRGARYDKTGCPICTQLTPDGSCSYCNSTGHCTYCKGNKERTTVSPNISEDSPQKPFSYKEPCPFCKSSGVCTYCAGSGKCWSCNGTRKVGEKWSCLNTKTTEK